MSTSIRSRRPPSPTQHAILSTHNYPPPPKDYFHADERRDAAAKGSHKPPLPGGLQIAPGEWKLLVLVLIVASFVRLYRISKPDSVVYACTSFAPFAY